MAKDTLKFVTFKDFAMFMPMYNPVEMEHMGIYADNHDYFTNKYGVRASHKHWHKDTDVDKNWCPYDWYKWYQEFYKEKRLISEDKFMIANWMRYTLYLYKVIIVPDPPAIDISKEWKQALLEVGCFYKQPIMHNKWTLTKFLEHR